MFVPLFIFFLCSNDYWTHIWGCLEIEYSQKSNGLSSSPTIFRHTHITTLTIPCQSFVNNAICWVSLYSPITTGKKNVKQFSVSHSWRCFRGILIVTNLCRSLQPSTVSWISYSPTIETVNSPPIENVNSPLTISRVQLLKRLWLNPFSIVIFTDFQFPQIVTQL